MTNYNKMNELMNGINLKDIAYGDLVDNKVTAYIRVENETVEQITFTYDNIEQVQDFCDSIEYFTNGEFDAVDWFDRFLDGLDIDKEVEISEWDEIMGHEFESYKTVYIEFERGI